MDSIVYNLFGYVTPVYADLIARKIQRAYRNHVNYKINWRKDHIFNRIPHQIYNDEHYLNEEKEEIDYWNNQRYYIKNTIQWERL